MRSRLVTQPYIKQKYNGVSSPKVQFTSFRGHSELKSPAPEQKITQSKPPKPPRKRKRPPAEKPPLSSLISDDVILRAGKKLLEWKKEQTQSENSRLERLNEISTGLHNLTPQKKIAVGQKILESMKAEKEEASEPSEKPLFTLAKKMKALHKKSIKNTKQGES